MASTECSSVTPVATAVEAGHPERMKKHVLMPLRWKDWEDSEGFMDSKETNYEWVLNKAGVNTELFDTVKAMKL